MKICYFFININIYIYTYLFVYKYLYIWHKSIFPSKNTLIQVTQIIYYYILSAVLNVNRERCCLHPDGVVATSTSRGTFRYANYSNTFSRWVKCASALNFAIFSVHFAPQDGAMSLYDIPNRSVFSKTDSENIKPKPSHILTASAHWESKDKTFFTYLSVYMIDLTFTFCNYC